MGALLSNALTVAAPELGVPLKVASALKNAAVNFLNKRKAKAIAKAKSQADRANAITRVLGTGDGVDNAVKASGQALSANNPNMDKKASQDGIARGSNGGGSGMLYILAGLGLLLFLALKK